MNISPKEKQKVLEELAKRPPHLELAANPLRAAATQAPLPREQRRHNDVPRMISRTSREGRASFESTADSNKENSQKRDGRAGVNVLDAGGWDGSKMLKASFRS